MSGNKSFQIELWLNTSDPVKLDVFKTEREDKWGLVKTSMR